MEYMIMDQRKKRGEMRGGQKRGGREKPERGEKGNCTVFLVYRL